MNTHFSEAHWLNRMLKPKSVALVGVSARKGSIGYNMLEFLLRGEYKGNIYPVNPRYDTIKGLFCYDALSDLPEVPDLVILGVGGRFIEQVFDEAVELGVGGMVIFFNNYLAEDREPPLLERLRQKARAANIPVCGGNGMGFYNYDASLIASFDFPPSRPAGHIALIAHSGSVMTYLANNDARLGFNLVVSSGQEIHATAADYADYALEQPSTRVVTLFLEAVRDVKRFVTMLQKAQARKIPVIITKVGRTEKSARFAASHSGALAGNDVAFQALCDRYGVIRTSHLDEMMATALLFAQGRTPAAGGLASIFDSGGLREQFIDLAEEIGVPFADISDSTREQLSKTLEYGLEAENPLDAMGSFNLDLETIWCNCLQALADDPDTALLSIEFEFRDTFCHYPQLYNTIEYMQTATEKPVFVLSSSLHNSNRQKAIELTQAGIPVISGANLALQAVRHFLWYRDARQWAAEIAQPPTTTGAPLTAVKVDMVAKWQTRLSENRAVDEAMGLQMLADFGLPAVPHQIANSLQEALAAAEQLGYPLVLKTAEANIHHKSDSHGVKLSLQNRTDIINAYNDLSQRLGPRVVVASMITSGVELAFGMVNDAQFGPIVMVSAGGIYVELLADRAFALAPFTETEALRLIKQLRIYPLLQGIRGKPPLRVDLTAQALAQFSTVAYALRDQIAEIDINPLIVSEESCTIVDTLLVCSSQE